MSADHAPIFQAAQAVGTGEYHREAGEAHAAALASRQRTFLRDLARRAFPQRRPILHDFDFDFDCGGGLAVRLLRGAVRTAYGYYPSAAALAAARAAGGYAQLHELSLDGALPAPATTQGPALVTVLGLRPDAPPAGRELAVGFAAQVLPDPDAGLMVLESRHPHQDRAEIERLLTRHGFEVAERRGFGLCTPGSYGYPWLRPIARHVDELISRYASAAGLSTNLLYVARRMPRFWPPHRPRPAQRH